jgi:hypothetical protein
MIQAVPPPTIFYVRVEDVLCAVFHRDLTTLVSACCKYRNV